jgi:3',5'-nucleoside bisphosphate phosphatase
LESTLAGLRASRRTRNIKILEKLNKYGFPVTEDDLNKVAQGETIGRPHIARMMLQKGFVTSIREAFDRFLALGSAAYVPKEEMPLQEAIQLLHASGAVTSAAHPMLLGRTYEELEESFKEWKSWGLDALEIFYPTYLPEQSIFLKRMADKYEFLATGGSDFHGENKPHLRIGVGYGNLAVPDELIEPLINRKELILKKLN